MCVDLYEMVIHTIRIKIQPEGFIFILQGSMIDDPAHIDHAPGPCSAVMLKSHSLPWVETNPWEFIQ
jgi:hypothetical protein